MEEKEIKVGKNINLNISRGKSGLYFVGFVGAAIYFVSTATDFWSGVVGLLKAAIWPGFLVFQALQALGA
jgi:hypothetical protein